GVVGIRHNLAHNMDAFSFKALQMGQRGRADSCVSGGLGCHGYELISYAGWHLADLGGNTKGGGEITPKFPSRGPMIGQFSRNFRPCENKTRASACNTVSIKTSDINTVLYKCMPHSFGHLHGLG